MQQKSSVQYAKIDAITVSDRLRKDMGDLTAFAAAINREGIICPIGVTPDMELIYGQRRLEAAKMAKLDLVPYIVIETPDDHDAYRSMEMSENTHRKDFTIEEKIRIVDLYEPRVKDIKDRIRKARTRQDTNAAEMAHKELEQILAKSIAEVPGKRAILSQLVGLGERGLEWAREVVHAADESGSPVLRAIVDEMNKTGAVRTAFDKYLATLPPAPFADDDGDDDDEPFFARDNKQFFEEEAEEEEEPAEQQRNVGAEISKVIDDADDFAKSSKKPKPERKPKPEQKEEAPVARATKPRGESRTHRPPFDEEALKSQQDAFVKRTLRGIDAEHQERALQILTGGGSGDFAASVMMSSEVTDAESALKRVEAFFEQLPPDHQNRLASALKHLAGKYSGDDCAENYLPTMPADQEAALELVSDELRVRFRGLKDMADWDASKERASAVRQFAKTTRRRLLEFEKHTAVGADADKTLFEADADFPEHLAVESFQELWAEWWSERKRRKLSVTSSVKKKQLKLLGIGDVEQACAIVSKAIENTWQGIPDGIWEGTLWCGRVPAFADEKLLKKIKATPPKSGSYQTKDEETRDQQKRRGRYVDDEE